MSTNATSRWPRIELLSLVGLLLIALRAHALESRWTHPDAVDLVAGESLDVSSRKFVNNLLHPGDGTWVLATLAEGSSRKASITDSIDTFAGTALTIATLQGQLGQKEWQYEYPVRHRGVISNRNENYPCFLQAGAGTALLRVVPGSDDATMRVMEGFLVPSEWAKALAEFWKAGHPAETIPHAQVQKSRLSEWEAAIDSPNPATGLIALTKLCQSRLVPPDKIARSHLRTARGVRQAAYVIIILREARDEDVKGLILAIDEILRQARAAEAIKGLATGLALSGRPWRARQETDRILLGYSTDLSGIRSLTVGDRIGKHLLSQLADRLTQIDDAPADEQIRRARLRVGLGFSNESVPPGGELVTPPDEPETSRAVAPTTQTGH
jgi:hypothetical protein